MKTAICFTGTCRSLQHTYKNLLENLINPIENCDVFAFIAENPHSHKFNEYLNIYNLKDAEIKKEGDYDLSSYKFRKGWPPPRSSPQIYVRMLHSRNICGKMIERYENKNNFVYDRIIFSRLDVKYFSNISNYCTNLDLSFLYIPDFHNTFGGYTDGINDRFAMSNSKNMKNYFKLSDNILTYVKSGGLLHGETFLKWHIDNCEIKTAKIPIRFTRVRGDGEEIDVRLKNFKLHACDT